MQLTTEELLQYLDRLENCQKSIDNAKEDLKSVFAAAKGDGYDDKALRKLLFIRKKGKAKFDEEQMILDTYIKAAGL